MPWRYGHTSQHEASPEQVMEDVAEAGHGGHCADARVPDAVGVCESKKVGRTGENTELRGRVNTHQAQLQRIASSIVL